MRKPSLEFFPDLLRRFRYPDKFLLFSSSFSLDYSVEFSVGDLSICFYPRVAVATACVDRNLAVQYERSVAEILFGPPEKGRQWVVSAFPLPFLLRDAF